MSNHELIVTILAFAIGLVLSIPVTWAAFKWFEYRDRTRVERMMRRMRDDDE